MSVWSETKQDRVKVKSVRRLPVPMPVPRPPKEVSTKILRINRQIHDEAIGVLYGQPLSFDNIKTLNHFLAQKSEVGVKTLQNISIDVLQMTHIIYAEYAAAYSAFTLLSRSLNLQSLTIHGIKDEHGRCHQGSSKDVAKWFYGLANPWLDRIKRRKNGPSWQSVLSLEKDAYQQYLFRLVHEPKNIHDRHFTYHPDSIFAELEVLMAKK
jgi:hypothetical protein